MRNLAQTKCTRCQRWHFGCAEAGCIPDDQWQELVDYAKANGRTWKSKLRDDWFLACSSILRWAKFLIDLDKVKLDACRYERRVKGKFIVGKPK